jgi:hypothetical protein
MRFRISTCLLLVLAAAGVARAATVSGPRLTIDLREVDFGVLDPTLAGSAPPARVNLLLASSAAWQISIATAPDGASNSDSRPLLGWRVPGERLRELVPMVPTPIASGGPTGTGQTPLVFELAALGGWDVPAGRYALRLQFFVNGVVATDALRVAFVVPPRVDMVMSSSPMESPDVNPIEPGSFPYPTRTATITSNVPWKLSARVEAPPRRSGSEKALATAGFRVGVSRTEAQTLVPGVAQVLARGAATGSRPKSVTIEVLVDLKGGEAAGKYRSRLRFSADPDSTP